MALTKQEKLSTLKQNIAKAEEEGDEEYVKILYELYYSMEVENQTINVYDGGTVIFQTGNPKPPPPYGGG